MFIDIFLFLRISYDMKTSLPASDGRHRSGHVNICLYIYIYIISRCIFEKTYREIYRYIDIYIICLHLTDAIAQVM